MRRRSPLAAIAVTGLAVATMAGLLAGGLGGTAAAAEAKVPAATAATTGTAGCGQAPALASGTHTIQSSGQARSYTLELPSTYTSSHPYRLIFAFHWLNGTAADVDSGDNFGAAWSYYGLRAQAGATTIFVAPQGINNGWANSGGADLTFVQNMLSLFESGLCIDPSEIFAMGWIVIVLSGISIALLTWMIQRGAASKVASLFYLTPPVAARQHARAQRRQQTSAQQRGLTDTRWAENPEHR